MSQLELGIRMEPEYFGPFWKYVKNPNVTDVDYNGRQFWITVVEN